MKHEKLAEALGQISDEYIAQAQKSHRMTPTLSWMGAIAAVLALAIITVPMLHRLGQTPQPVGTTPGFTYIPANRFLIAAPQYPQVAAYPAEYDAGGYDAWWNGQRALRDQPEGYADNLEGYFASLVPALLQSSGGKNAVCSPLNIYMALAMLAEVTDGQSRQQILDLLKADSIQALRTQAGQIWKAHYNDDGLSKSILGSSLWLEEGYGYNEDTAKLLAEHYFASVFRGDLGSDEMNQALQSWLNEQTDGLLQEQAGNMELSPSAVLALATTVCYQVQWQEDFSRERNTQKIFHGAAGDQEATFMYREMTFGPYYWGDCFGAVYLNLEDGSRMWLLLPDEGYAPEDILDDMAAFLSHRPAHTESNYPNRKSLRVNLSLPKFDVSAQRDIADTLKQLGVTDVFDGAKADFTPIFPQDDGGFVSGVNHAARVAIDEEGVTAAAFTVIERAGGAAVIDREMDFILDRPFVFYVESRDGLPLFTGIVNGV